MCLPFIINNQFSVEMPNLILKEVSCPNCQNAIDVREHGQHVECDACASRFILQGHLCPNCSKYHKGEAPFCSNCGQNLTRTCRRCHTNNWAGDEYCTKCGEAMDIFDLLSMQHEAAHSERLAQRDEMIRNLKAQEEASSQKRLAEFREMEAQMRSMARQKEAQRKKDERFTLVALIGGLFVIFLVIFLVLLVMGL